MKLRLRVWDATWLARDLNTINDLEGSYSILSDLAYWNKLYPDDN